MSRTDGWFDVMKIAMSIEGIFFFLTVLLFITLGLVVPSFFFFFFYRIYPPPNTMCCTSPQKQLGPLSLKARVEEWLFKAIITFPTFSALVKLLLEGSVYNKCLMSGILQFHRPWQLGMKRGGIVSIVNEYAIYILIKLCTSGVKECHLEHLSYSVYIIVVYLRSLLFAMSQPHPLNAIL